MAIDAVLLVAVGIAAAAAGTGRLRTVGPVGAVDPAGDPVEVGDVSVVIPARNEATSVPVLLRSLAALDRPPLEVIVVDDGSTDGTGRLARDLGATVVAADPPPPGWAGKPWACWTGARHAAGTTLVFLDADTTLAPDGLARVVAAARALAPDGLLSVAPHHATVAAYEQLSAVPNVVTVLGSGAFRWPRGRDVGVAFGPCLVTTTEAYRAVGGHGAVAGEVIEDLHLARCYRAAGRPVRALAGGDAVAYRMYPDGPAQLAEGWTKNLAGGARLVPATATVATGLWVTGGLAGAGAAVEALVTATPSWGALAWLAFTAQLWWLLRRLGSFRWWAAPASPVLLVVFVALFARSILHRSLRRRVRWRGRVIELRAGTG